MNAVVLEVIQYSWLPWRWIKQTSTQNQFPFFPKVSSEAEREQEMSPFVSLMGQFPQCPAAWRGKRVPEPDGRGSHGPEETAWGTNSSLFSPHPCSPRSGHFPVFVHCASDQKIQTINCAWEPLSHFSCFTIMFTYLIKRDAIFNLLSFFYSWAKPASLFIPREVKANCQQL